MSWFLPGVVRGGVVIGIVGFKSTVSSTARGERAVDKVQKSSASGFDLCGN